MKMLFASDILNGRWADMSNFPHDNEDRRNTGERKNYAELNLTLDGRVWEAIKTNKKFVALCMLFALNFLGSVSIRDLTVMNRKEITALQDTVKDYEAMKAEVAMCKETQRRQIELFPLIEQLTNLLKNNRPIFRNPQARREFDEVTTKILKIKPLSQNNGMVAEPTLPAASTAPVRIPANE